MPTEKQDNKNQDWASKASDKKNNTNKNDKPVTNQVKQKETRTEQPKKKWAEKVSSNPIFILCITIGTALGGVPGILQLIDYLKKDTDFYFTPRTGSVMILSPPDHSFTVLLLVGTFANFGKQPILIAGFDLSLKLNNKEIQCLRMRAPQVDSLLGSKNTVKFDSSKRYDMSEAGVLNVNSPLVGSLGFAINLRPEELHLSKGMDFSLTCTDIKGEPHTRKFHTVPQTYDSSFSFPQGGIIIEGASK